MPFRLEIDSIDDLIKFVELVKGGNVKKEIKELIDELNQSTNPLLKAIDSQGGTNG